MPATLPSIYSTRFTAPAPPEESPRPMKNLSQFHFDTVIIGARCAGAFTALHLARAGQRVLVVDRDQPGTDTLSTHALMRLGVSLLDEADVLPAIQRAGTPAIRRTVFTYGGASVPLEISQRGRAEGLYAPRRHVLDTILVDAAAAAGAIFSFQTVFQQLTYRSDGRVGGVALKMPDGDTLEVSCDIVVGADGFRSAVSGAVGARALRTSQNKTSTIYTYVEGLDLAGYEWFFGHGVMAGLIPTNETRTCAFVSLTPEDMRKTAGRDQYQVMREIFDQCGAPQDILPTAPAERIRRFIGAHGHMRQAWGNGWALVGDAGYFKDTSTAHGITDALRDATLLSDAILSGTENALRDYQSRRDELSVEFFAVTDRIASLDWSMDEVQDLHMDLHRLMRAEQEDILGTDRRMVA